MRLCVGTAKGIVILDPHRGGAPCMISADPPSIWCLAQDCSDPRLLYAGSIHNNQAGSARGKSALAVSEDGGRIWRDITPGSIRDEEVWALAAAPDRHGEVLVGTSHARLFRSDDGGRTLRENTAFAKLPGGIIGPRRNRLMSRVFDASVSTRTIQTHFTSRSSKRACFARAIGASASSR